MPAIPARKILIPIGIFFVALIIAVLLVTNPPEAKKRSRPAPAAIVVDVIQVEKGDFPVIVQAMGEVTADREVQLSALVGGEVISTADNFAPGGLVKAGDPLLQIDTRDYEFELSRQQALLEQAEGAYEIELGQQKNARQDLALLHKDNVKKPNDTYLVLRGPQLKQAEAGLQQAKSELKKARLNLERTTVHAPFNALIVERMVNLGTRVAAQQTLATLVDTDDYWVKISVPVDKLPWLDVGVNGSRAVVSMSNGRGKRTGHVARIIGRLEQGSRLAPLIVNIDDPLLLQADDNDGRKPMLLGDYVDVRLSGRTLEGAYRVPHHYVRDGNIVWIARNKKMVFVPITILHKDRDYTYFNADLQKDERVIISNVATPVDGMQIEISGTPAPAETEEVSLQGKPGVNAGRS